MFLSRELCEGRSFLSCFPLAASSILKFLQDTPQKHVLVGGSQCGFFCTQASSVKGMHQSTLARHQPTSGLLDFMVSCSGEMLDDPACNYCVCCFLNIVFKIYWW